MFDSMVTQESLNYVALVKCNVSSLYRSSSSIAVKDNNGSFISTLSMQLFKVQTQWGENFSQFPKSVAFSILCHIVFCPWTQILIVPLGWKLHYSTHYPFYWHWAQNQNLCASHSSKPDFTVSNICWWFFHEMPLLVYVDIDWFCPPPPQVSCSTGSMLRLYLSPTLQFNLFQSVCPVSPRKRSKSNVKNINYFTL